MTRGSGAFSLLPGLSVAHPWVRLGSWKPTLSKAPILAFTACKKTQNLSKDVYRQLDLRAVSLQLFGLVDP